MGLLDKLISSIVAVVAGLLGFGMLVGGAREAAFGSQTVGTIIVVVGIILLVFATKL